MIKILKLLNTLGLKVIQKWHTSSFFGKDIDYCDFKHKGKRYVISTCDGKSYVCTETGKKCERTIYIGYSFNGLESALKKELGYDKNIN